MKYIELTQGQRAIVDDVDYEELVKYKWCVNWAPKTNSYYAVRNQPYPNGKQHILSMHRVIMAAPSGLVVDHINHDTLDNRRENLRICTKQQNTQNSNIRATNTSGYRGVRLDKGKKRWRVQISINGKNKHLGYFDDFKEASKTYEMKAREVFGKYYNSISE